MATIAKITREQQLYRGENQAAREAIKALIKAEDTTPEERIRLATKLDARPRKESRVRLTRRCQMCGRPKSVYRRFKLCRCCLRKLAMAGIIPGLRKASW